MPQAPQKILELIDRFERNIESYRHQAYNETQVRQEFINPFFEALGWDITNRVGYAEAYKDVIHEDAIKIGSATKAPDYCFRIGGVRKFFLEAKKPFISVKDDANPAYQLRRYAWSAKLPLSILTDFEEFAIYDCRIRPRPADKSSVGRILYLTYQEYAARWEEIASVISKEAVLQGSFDKFVTGKGRRGTSEVDAEFLTEIEGWRDALARNIALRNPRLTVRELNFAVQRTIDRIIFLRMCEDRGIEIYGQLMGLLNGENIYDRLQYIYRLADDRYNSGLFHFKAEKGRREEPDELTLRLKVDDKVLKEIIRHLYYPESPYEFSVLSADILGNVYEQFLGKVIRLTAGHRAVVEEKPEVKKAGGVYYTPAYIVDYIVRNTVGKRCEGKTPKQIAKLRILDPACGSGSFLIGAYTYLLNYHRDWYLKDGVEKHTKEIYQGAGGQWHLTTQEKRRVLLNNIHGVDIDSQAVEVTKLSLLLKVLEGENQDSLSRQLKMWRERALPDLGNNIKCGNSLIGSDYYEGRQVTMFDNEEIRLVNAFDWETEYPEIMNGGGFDVVIGNPPYAYRNATEDMVRPYYVSRYKSAEGNFDLYKFFIERGLALIRKDGYIGLIVSATFLIQPSFEKLRFLLIQSTIERLSPLGPRAFVNATVDTTIIIIQRKLPGDNHTVIIQAPQQPTDLPSAPEYGIKQSRFVSNDGYIFDYRLTDTGSKIVARLFKNFPNLETGFEFGVGINTGFIRNELVAKSKIDERYHPMVAGDGISRYGPVQSDEWIMYDKEFVQKRGKLGRSLPAEHLLSSEKILVVRTRNLSLPRRIVATLDRSRAYNLNRLSNIVVRPGYNLTGLLGVLNSQLFNWFYSTHYYDYEIKPVYLRASPLAETNNPVLVNAVERMLDLHKRLEAAKTPSDKTKLQRQIDITDHQIDKLVYKLYSLAEEEIAIIEGNSIDSKATTWENEKDETGETKDDRSRRAERPTSSLAEEARHAGEGRRSTQEGAAGAGGSVDVVREPAGEYRTPEDPSEEDPDQIESTRLFETAQGKLPYPALSEQLAVALTHILEEILQPSPDQIVITSEWICLRHKDLAADLFPNWAGRYRDVNVQVGAHLPPPFYEVPILMRLFCEDLVERLRHIRPRESDVGVLAELLAWVDWRFQWIHPFKDFNGRIGRVLLAAILYKLALPHVITAPTEADVRTEYVEALRAADQGNLRPLMEVWLRRIAEAL